MILPCVNRVESYNACMKTKLCKHCNQEKPLEAFAKRGKSGRQPWCISCKKKYNQEYYEQNRETRTKSKQLKRAELRGKLRELKATLYCVECGENHPSCLEFHHLDPATKDFSIGIAIGKLWSWDRIQKEIAKCNCLCSNCHRKFHWEDEH